MTAILKKLLPSNRMRVKEVNLPLATSEILGNGIDVTTLPEGHLSCPKCSHYKFECWVYLDNHRIEMGCLDCGWSCRLLFPMDISLPGRNGKYACTRRIVKGKRVDHSRKGMILIHNTDVISIGCEACSNQMIIKLESKSNLILA